MAPMTETKRCWMCGDQLPLNVFSLDRRRSGGRGSYCLPCGRRYAAERRRAKGSQPSAERRVLQPGETKECRRCRRVLDATEFYSSKRNADGVRSYFKACDREKSREWQTVHPKRRNEIQRQYSHRKARNEPAS